MTGPIPIECTRYAEDWSALLDGELPPAREAELRAHLDDCARCRAKLASLARVDVLLAGLPVASANADLFARLRARIDANEASAAAPRLAPPRRRRALRLAAAAVAAAAALALYLALPRPRGEIAPQPPLRVAKAPQPREVPAAEPPIAPPAPAAPAPPTQVAERRAAAPAPAAPEPARDPEFDSLPADDLAAGMDLDTAKDLPVIANLELLERLVAMEEDRG
ncbi:MAG TPA: zf-HC2 domain-containing protein [Myxococcota bacterium]|nr:zf-HC2 domain-containing protein [Myxococcota bacterium]